MNRPGGSVWPPRASEAAVAELARRFDLDTVTTSPATLEHLDRAIERFGQAYLTTPPGELVEEVMRYERWVRELLAGDHTPSQSGELSVRLSYLNGILASLSFALGDHAAAQAYCATALGIAEELGHGRLKAWVLSTESQLATYHGDHQRVIDLTKAGLAATGGTPTFAAVKLASLQAKAHASLGDRPAAEAALAMARRSLTLVPPEEQVGGLFSFPAEKLASHEGDVYLRLGEPRRAQEALRRALTLLDTASGPRRSPVDQAMVHLHLAQASLQLGEVEEAGRLGIEALAIHAARPSDPTIRRARRLAAMLQPYRDLPAVRDFLGRLEAA
jgi:tetratricopeptide (TPR) repeat protein